MIPIKLALKNFMCYRDNVPPLSFDGIHVACLCGDNGNGKSALLDAITWALWGKTRAKSDDELIHVGRAEMEVEFEFASGRDRYRVLRKRARPRVSRSGHSLLDLQIATDQGFRPITGSSIRETQHKIIEILRMDYDTFINSAFLLQGRADEFTVKPPSERKEVLARILDLSLYDELEERAKIRARERESRSQELSHAIAEIDSELARKGEYEAELGGMREAIAELERDLKGQESRVNALRERKQELDFKREQLAQLEERISQAQRELAYLRSGAEEHREKVREYEGVISERKAIEEGFQRLVEAKRDNEELNSKAIIWVNANSRRSQLEQAVAKAKGELETEQRIGQDKVGQLEPKVNMLPQFETELTQAQGQVAELAAWEEELGQKRHHAQELSSEVHLLEAQCAQLEEEIRTLEEKIDLLTPEEARCPLCETELGIEGRNRIMAKYEQDRKGKGEALAANRRQLDNTKKEHRSLEAEVAQLEERIKRERAAGEARVNTLEGKITEAKQAEVELAHEKERLTALEERLAKAEFALEEQRGLGEVLAQLDELGYDSERHDEVRRRLAEVEVYEAMQRNLEQAQGSIDRERESLAEAEQAASAKEADLSAEAQKGEALSQALAALPEVEAELAEAQQVYDAFLERQRKGRDKLVEVKTRLKDLTLREQSKAEKKKELLQASREKGIYDELAAAFGKKGIQAWIIEQALPEIEEEANRLLSRMTDNRMHVKMETQRAYKTKKAETLETLDINTSDELGTRRYEMYSGGEAFRINFALRIALSKLLARRAGAPLPTLFIDEGFDTQDSSGKEKLIEAINSIQDDFEKIIVITHIDELKDAFPVRIDVTKTPEGSMIEVS
ncbi:MAG: SMC family ATPase [Dehalococcoidia bacterium]|nr:SMC family ATPase [Dehalococcoidia bacterium]